MAAMKIGSRVKVKKEVVKTNITYPVGHEFTIYNCSSRGFDLVDDEGRRLDETLYITHHFELIG